MPDDYMREPEADIRRRTIDAAKAEATALARRLKRFIDEYGGEGEQLLTIGETAWMADATTALVGFEDREVR